MLVEFRVENHRSIASEQVLTLEEGRAGDDDDRRPRAMAGHNARLLPIAAIYGANASGKSNVLSALGFMRQAVVASHRSWAPEGGVSRTPFAWGDWPGRPSIFEVTLLLSGVRYQYGFVADQERFLEEWLYAWPRGRKQTWYTREGDTTTFGEHLLGENRVIDQVTRPNALFLSAAAQHRHEQLTPIYAWFVDMNLLGAPGWTGRSLQRTPEQPQLDALRGLLVAADTGIRDLRLEDEPGGALRGPGHRPRRVLVRHASTTGDAWLPLDQESDGTLALVALGPALLDALGAGRALVVDELEASLHPLLALRILRVFQDPETNPRHAQLLFSTHDTHLLGTLAGDPPLRRDQVWLTEKDADGATRLYPLSDYKPRKGENVERGYLQGRYGAIPFLGALTPGKG